MEESSKLQLRMYREQQSLPDKWNAVKKAFKQIPKKWIRMYQADKQENGGVARTELGTGKHDQCCWSIKLSWEVVGTRKECGQVHLSHTKKLRVEHDN